LLSNPRSNKATPENPKSKPNNFVFVVRFFSNIVVKAALNSGPVENNTAIIDAGIDSVAFATNKNGSTNLHVLMIASLCKLLPICILGNLGININDKKIAPKIERNSITHEAPIYGVMIFIRGNDDPQIIPNTK
jgi:hypothetical protein